MATETKRQPNQTAPTEEQTIAIDEMPAGLAQGARDEAEHRRQVEVARRVMRENRAVLSELAK